MTREDLIQDIIAITSDVVIVGGTAQMYFKLKDNAKDIDIVVTSLNGFHVLGDIKHWFTRSPYSKSGKRAFIRRNDYSIDIFIENELPDSETSLTGEKYETVESMLDFYRDVYTKYDPITRWKQRLFIQSKIDLLTTP